MTIEQEQREQRERQRVLLEGILLECITDVPAWWRVDMARCNAASPQPPRYLM
jgi:hypothetical protein